MSYGFKVSRDTGEVLVDDTHITLAPLYRGAISTPSSPSVVWAGAGAGAGYYYADDTFGARYVVTYPAAITSDVPPVVALFPGYQPRGWFHAFRHLGGPGGWTGFEIGYRVATAWESLPTPIGTGASALNTGWEYAVANPEACPQSNERYGMRVFAPDGRLVFDSGTKIMRIVAPLVSWSWVTKSAGYHLFECPWSLALDGSHGVVVSSLPMYLQEGTNFGNTFVSPRIGFSSARPGKIVMGFAGSDRVSLARAAYSADNTLAMISQTGGLQTFAVRVG